MADAARERVVLITTHHAADLASLARTVLLLGKKGHACFSGGR
jgi:hypothetical protein